MASSVSRNLLPLRQISQSAPRHCPRELCSTASAASSAAPAADPAEPLSAAAAPFDAIPAYRGLRLPFAGHFVSLFLSEVREIAES